MSENETGEVAGVVEQPSTGRKERFHGVETIGHVIAGLLGGARAEDPEAREGDGSPP